MSFLVLQHHEEFWIQRDFLLYQLRRYIIIGLRLDYAHTETATQVALYSTDAACSMYMRLLNIYFTHDTYRDLGT